MIPSGAAKAIADLIKGFTDTFSASDDEGSVSAASVFPDLADPAKVIGMRFRAIRKKLSLTQEQIAERLGLDQADVSKMEKGARAISKTIAKKIEAEFKIDYRQFL